MIEYQSDVDTVVLTPEYIRRIHGHDTPRVDSRTDQDRETARGDIGGDAERPSGLAWTS